MDNVEVEQFREEAEDEVLRLLVGLQAVTGKFISSVAVKVEYTVDATIHDRHAVKASTVWGVRIELAELTV